MKELHINVPVTVKPAGSSHIWAILHRYGLRFQFVADRPQWKHSGVARLPADMEIPAIADGLLEQAAKEIKAAGVAEVEIVDPAPD